MNHIEAKQQSQPPTATEAKEDKYYPTPSEQQLLEVLFNPTHSAQPITEICRIAGIDRKTYYNAFDKKGFVDLYLQKSRDLIANSIHAVILASVRNSQRAEGFNDRKLLLEMGKQYIPQSSHEIVIVEGQPEASQPTADKS